MAPPLDPRTGPIPPYASTKLIAYLGNKRALLPFLRSAFLELESEAAISSFLDPFAGSGSVSRLARCLGYRVMANDAEEYSRAVNACWLGIPAEEGGRLFAASGGLEAELARVNRFHPQREDEEPSFPSGETLEVEPYIARHYAPRDTASADWRRERLFYTRENAVFLDRARSYVEARRSSGGLAAMEAELLVGCLVYEAATHANTSGVFKACHKGFGGHGRDALGRILSPMLLEPPLLWPGEPAELGRSDAAAFCSGRSADLCYLDPPYNQHQYGSNYHLLNTIARWDRPPVSEERDGEGRLVEKAGIPASWKASKSAFCSRKSALGAFKELVDAIDARFIVLSYNSEAFVPPEELYDLLARDSEVELRSVDYVKYRGGRQSAARLVRNRELLFVARRGPGRARAPAGSNAGAAGRERSVGELAADLRLARALAAPYDPRLLGKAADPEGRVSFPRGELTILLPTYRLLGFEEGAAEACAALGADSKNALCDMLEPAALRDNGRACEACIDLLESGCRERRLQDLALTRLRKIAHRKYGADFEALAERLARAARKGGIERLVMGVEALRELYGTRTAG